MITFFDVAVFDVSYFSRFYFIDLDVAKAEGEDEELMTPTAPVPALIEKTSPERTVAKLQRRLSEHKSFEMEDIPSSGDNGNPILCHPASLAQRRHLPPQQVSSILPTFYTRFFCRYFGAKNFKPKTQLYGLLL